MKQLFVACGLLVASLPSMNAFCTVSGQPGTVFLASRVIEMQDDEAWKRGSVVWVPMGIYNDTQVYTWLVWSHRPTGQACVARFMGVRNEHCGGRVAVQFEQRTPYNVGMALADNAAGAAIYPLACTVELIMHVYDSTPDPNPAYNPDDPMCPGPAIQCQPAIIDPGFHYYVLVDLRVTGLRMAQDGGNPSTPRDVTRNGECPLPEAGEELPAYMFQGPGCATPTRMNTPAGAAVVKSARPLTKSAAPGGASATAIVLTAQTKQAQALAAIRANATATLSRALAAVASQTTVREGRPVLLKR